MAARAPKAPIPAHEHMLTLCTATHVWQLAKLPCDAKKKGHQTNPLKVDGNKTQTLLNARSNINQAAANAEAPPSTRPHCYLSWSDIRTLTDAPTDTHTSWCHGWSFIHAGHNGKCQGVCGASVCANRPEAKPLSSSNLPAVVRFDLCTFSPLGTQKHHFGELWRTLENFGELWGTLGNFAHPTEPVFVYKKNAHISTPHSHSLFLLALQPGQTEAGPAQKPKEQRTFEVNVCLYRSLL